jgi:hypothetical protein
MININCAEGERWQDEKQGVVRIVTYLYTDQWNRDIYGLCSGSMINNTARDLDPLFLSAFHCYMDLTEDQIAQTVYYFKYEHPGCTGRSDPNVPTLIGATILVSNPLGGGSDGMLLRLNEGSTSWFTSRGIYFNGWDRRNVPATSGVGIHHPNGDVKKISTFTATVVSFNANFSGYGSTAPNSGWRVFFAATQSGHSSIQGGSSGSPLFNQDRRIV